jgi:CHAT domain-containing protein
MHYFDFTVMGPSQPPRMIYAAWIVPPPGQGEVQVIELGKADAIESAVDDVRRTLRAAAASIADVGEANAEAELRRPLAQLSKSVLNPLEPAIGGYTHWIVSADAALWLVPWSALVLSDGRYVIEEHRVDYRISGRDLLQPPTPIAKGPAFVLANPDFNVLPARRVAAEERPLTDAIAKRGQTRAGASLSTAWPALPGTAVEAQAIAPQISKLLKSPPTLLTAGDAAEARFKTLSRPRLVVLSTHGFFDDSSNEESESEVRNPLLSCGLILAGANRRNERTDLAIDDGILTGLEIVGTDLRGTELVVLSACETGLGQVQNGEGVAGLRQAFQLAGAQSVVATLWQIPDQESAQLMTGFFTNLADGQTKADALRNAQLALIKSRHQHGAAHPFFWAAFTLTGG